MTDQLTVVCAVWHRQRNLELLLRQHTRCLQKQTVPVRIIYVADGGLDIGPVDERITVVSVDRGVTVAESFNMALALTDTEFFAALNLDDYYFADAAALHVETMRAQQLDLLGADWELRFDPQAHVDRSCYDIAALRPCDTWPPTRRSGQRLGSGDGVNPTFGPAPVFRTSAVRAVGGYPRQFGDGTRVGTIIDFILWDRLARTGRRMSRLPLVVGTYLSDPSTQQEFRGGADAVADEHRHYERHGARV